MPNDQAAGFPIGTELSFASPMESLSSSTSRAVIVRPRGQSDESRPR